MCLMYLHTLYIFNLIWVTFGAATAKNDSRNMLQCFIFLIRAVCWFCTFLRLSLTGMVYSVKVLGSFIKNRLREGHNFLTVVNGITFTLVP